MKFLKSLLEDHEGYDDPWQVARMMINAAVEELGDDLSKESVKRYIQGHFYFDADIENAIDVTLDEESDTTPLEQEEYDVEYNQPCEYGHMHCSTRYEGPCSDEIGHTFEAHEPKDDAKLNKRLQEVLKMVKKWKGPKPVKKVKESMLPRVDVPAENLSELLDDLSVQDLVMQIAHIIKTTETLVNRRIIIQVAQQEGVELAPEEVDILLKAFQRGTFEDLG